MKVFRRLKRGEIIQKGDMVFCSQISISIHGYNSMNKYQKSKFRDSLSNTPPMYHPVRDRMIGKAAPYIDPHPIVAPIEIYRKKS